MGISARTGLTKFTCDAVGIVLNMMVCMFSGYCKNQWAVEPVMVCDGSC